MGPVGRSARTSGKCSQSHSKRKMGKRSFFPPYLHTHTHTHTHSFLPLEVVTWSCDAWDCGSHPANTREKGLSLNCWLSILFDLNIICYPQTHNWFWAKDYILLSTLANLILHIECNTVLSSHVNWLLVECKWICLWISLEHCWWVYIRLCLYNSKHCRCYTYY